MLKAKSANSIIFDAHSDANSPRGPVCLQRSRDFWLHELWDLDLLLASSNTLIVASVERGIVSGSALSGRKAKQRIG